MIVMSIIRRRSRMLIALLAIILGATILSGLVTIYYDVPRQMGAEFRNYGANVVFTPGEGQENITREAMLAGISNIPSANLGGYTPYRYENTKIHNNPVTVAAVDLGSVLKTSPYWHIEGEMATKNGQVLVGSKVAEALGLSWGSKVTATNTHDLTALVEAHLKDVYDKVSENPTLTLMQVDEYEYLDYFFDVYASAIRDAEAETIKDKIIVVADKMKLDVLGAQDIDFSVLEEVYWAELKIDDTVGTVSCDHELELDITGILETGGSEEEYIYISLDDAAYLTLLDRGYDFVEVSVSATEDQLSNFIKNINNSGTGVTAKPIKRVTASEGAVLQKLQSLVFIVTAVVLVLTMICVATTMVSVIAERRKEIGLRKAIGASNGSIIGEFMCEGMLLGAVGGIIGAVLGYVFADVVSLNVFASSILFRPALIPITILASIIVTGIACLIPIRSAVDVNPAIVLKGE